LELAAGKTEVFGLSRDFYVVSKLSRDELYLALDAGGVTSGLFPSYTRLSPEDRWDTLKGFGWIALDLYGLFNELFNSDRSQVIKHMKNR
jgi:alkaline phosphatase D